MLKCLHLDSARCDIFKLCQFEYFGFAQYKLSREQTAFKVDF